MCGALACAPIRCCRRRISVTEMPFFVDFVFIIFPLAALASALLYCRRAEWRAKRAEAEERVK